MPKGYWVAHVDVRDPEAYEKYKAANAEPFAKYGARFLVRGGPGEVREGTAKGRTVVIEFASYADAVAWGSENGIIKDYDRDSYGPDDNITREQLSAVLYRYARHRGYDMTASDDLAAYSDADDISDWALENVRWVVAEGLMRGTSASELSPGSECTRAETAAMLMRFIKEFG